MVYLRGLLKRVDKREEQRLTQQTLTDVVNNKIEELQKDDPRLFVVERKKVRLKMLMKLTGLLYSGKPAPKVVIVSKYLNFIYEKIIGKEVSMYEFEDNEALRDKINEAADNFIGESSSKVDEGAKG